MMTLFQWRIKLREQDVPSPMKPEGDPMDAPKAMPATPPPRQPPTPRPQPPHPGEQDDGQTKADFSWLKWFFGKVRQTPKTGMTSALRQRIDRLHDELTADHEQGLSNEVENLKDQYATLFKPDKSGGNFKADVPATVAMKFAMQIMGAVLKLILPGSSGAGRMLDTKAVAQFGGDEGEGDWNTLKRVVGKRRIPIPFHMLSNLRGVVKGLMRKYADQYHIEDWTEDVPKVKEFTLDMLAAVLKSVFPASEASGGGRGVSTSALSRYQDKISKQPAEPEQTMQPPSSMEV